MKPTYKSLLSFLLSSLFFFSSLLFSDSKEGIGRQRQRGERPPSSPAEFRHLERLATGGGISNSGGDEQLEALTDALPERQIVKRWRAPHRRRPTPTGHRRARLYLTAVMVAAEAPTFSASRTLTSRKGTSHGTTRKARASEGTSLWMVQVVTRRRRRRLRPSAVNPHAARLAMVPSRASPLPHLPPAASPPTPLPLLSSRGGNGGGAS